MTQGSYIHSATFRLVMSRLHILTGIPVLISIDTRQKCNVAWQKVEAEPISRKKKKAESIPAQLRESAARWSDCPTGGIITDLQAADRAAPRPGGYSRHSTSFALYLSTYLSFCIFGKVTQHPRQQQRLDCSGICARTLSCSSVARLSSDMYAFAWFARNEANCFDRSPDSSSRLDCPIERNSTELKTDPLA